MYTPKIIAIILMVIQQQKQPLLVIQGWYLWLPQIYGNAYYLSFSGTQLLVILLSNYDQHYQICHDPTSLSGTVMLYRSLSVSTTIAPLSSPRSPLLLILRATRSTILPPLTSTRPPLSQLLNSS